MKRAALAVACALLAALATTPAAAQNPPSPPDSLRVLAVRPGDVVKIQVWGHEELSGEFPVDENFDLFYPIIGAINVRALSVPQFRERLYRELEQLFQRPFIVITPLFRVAVLGEVLRPSLYSVDPTMTIYDIIALAGGTTPSANQRKIQLVRGGEEVRLTLDAPAIGRATLRDLGVRSGDHIVVARKRFTREDLGLLLQAGTLILVAYQVFH
jgi:protein involved in polysaccharide export with SLBB domain